MNPFKLTERLLSLALDVRRRLESKPVEEEGPDGLDVHDDGPSLPAFPAGEERTQAPEWTDDESSSLDDCGAWTPSLAQSPKGSTEALELLKPEALQAVAAISISRTPSPALATSTGNSASTLAEDPQPPPYSSVAGAWPPTPPLQRRPISTTDAPQSRRSFIPSFDPKARFSAFGESLQTAGVSAAQAAAGRLDTLQTLYDVKLTEVTRTAEVAHAFISEGADLVIGLLWLTLDTVWTATKATASATWNSYQVFAKAERWWPPTDAIIQSLQNIYSQYIIDMTVLTAIWIKRSPFPDWFSAVAETAMDGYHKVDAEYEFQKRIAAITEQTVKLGVWLTSVLATAGVRGALAFQRTPGWRERDSVKLRRKRNKMDDLRRQQRKSGRNEASFSDSDIYAYSSATRSSATSARWSAVIPFLPAVPTDPKTSVRISVGGYQFTTTLGTLMSVPGSRLEKMFSDAGRKSLGLVDGGAYFVDRDGVHFRHVLNFLRGVDTIAAIEDSASLKELKGEAEWYGLDALSQRIDEVLLVQEQARAENLSLHRAGRLIKGTMKYFSSPSRSQKDAAVTPQSSPARSVGGKDE